MTEKKEKHYVAKGEKEKSYSEKEKPAYDWRAKCHDKKMEGNT